MTHTIPDLRTWNQQRSWRAFMINLWDKDYALRQTLHTHW